MTAQIVVDARKLGDGGIGVYIENLIDGFLELREHRLITLSLAAFVAPHATLPESWNGQLECVEERAGKYSFDEYVGLARRHRELFARSSLFHSPHYTLPFFLRVPSVVTIHDTIHITHPERRAVRVAAQALIKSAVRRADHVICVSHSGQQQLLQAVGSIPGGVSVVPNALRKQMRIIPSAIVSQFLRNWKAVGQYCLFVGSERPHKGFRELIEAWELLRSREPQIPSLVVIGDRFGSAARELVRAKGLESVVHFIGSVTTDELVHLYNGAQAVVVPSRIEGFGLPALEAMACGSAVVCSPHPSLVELCEDRGWIAADYSSEALCVALQEMLNNQSVRAERIERGIRYAQQFSRMNASLLTCQVYEDITGMQVVRSNGQSPSVSADLAVGKIG